MADAWGGSWGSSWGTSWGGSTTPPVADTPVTTAGRSFGTQYRAKTLSREAREKEARKARVRIVRQLPDEPSPALLALIDAGLEQQIIADAELTRAEWKQEHARIEQLILQAALRAAEDEEAAIVLLLSN